MKFQRLNHVVLKTQNKSRQELTHLGEGPEQRDLLKSNLCTEQFLVMKKAIGVGTTVGSTGREIVVHHVPLLVGIAQSNGVRPECLRSLKG